MSAVQIVQIPLAGDQQAGVSAVKELVGKFKAAEGAQSSLWAPQHEDDKVIGIATVWNSAEAQKTWSESQDGSALAAQIRSVAAGPVQDETVVFDEDPSLALSAHAVELVSWIHPAANVDDDKRREVEAGFRKFQQAILSQAPESDGGLVGGWSQSEFEHGGAVSRRWTLLIGWKSVDAHYACKKTPVFLDNIHWLMDYGHTEVEMVHYAFSQSQS